mgnify:CR=1 FL=1
MPSIVHFEIPADNIERAQNFYAHVFNWKIEKAPGDYEYYSVITKNDENEPGIHGGMMKRQDAEQTITNYINVDSVDEYCTKVEKAGGKILVPKSSVPGMGFFALCQDTENNAFGFWMDDSTAT